MLGVVSFDGNDVLSWLDSFPFTDASCSSLPPVTWAPVSPLFIVLKLFYLRVIALQCSVDFCCTTVWLSYKYSYMPSFLSLPHNPLFFSLIMSLLLRSLVTYRFSSIIQSCPTLCDPMNCSTPGLPVHRQHPELTQLISITSVMPSNHLILCCPFSSCLQSFPASGSFAVNQFFASHGQSIGVSASTSVPPMNTQDWSPLGWNGWISLQSKGLSRVFSNTTIQNHQFFGAQLSSQSNSHIHTWPLEKA